MTSETVFITRALQFLCDENVHICRLCLCSTEGSKEYNLRFQVQLNKYQLKDIVYVEDMLRELGASEEEELPATLCANCYTVVLNSYIFKKLCLISEERWSVALDKLEECLLNVNEVKHTYKSMYFCLNKDYTYVSLTRKKILHNQKTEAVSYFKNCVLKKKNSNKNLNGISTQSSSNFCEMCSETFENKAAYWNHNSQYHSDTKFKCNECNKSYNNKFLLKYHHQKDHLPKILKCDKCPKKFSNERLRKQHIADSHIPEECPICNEMIPSKIQSRYHIAAHKKHKCSRCNKEFTAKISCTEHEKHCGQPATKITHFFCDICGRGYVRKQGLRSHIKMDHGFGATFKCEWCERAYDAPSKLKWHILKHTKEKKFFCEKCGNKFVTAAALQSHIRLHTGERPYPCSYCPEKFSSTSRRMEHVHRKHNAPDKQCKLCPMKFATGSALNVHIKRHFNPSSKLYVKNNKNSFVTDEKGRTVMVVHVNE